MIADFIINTMINGALATVCVFSAYALSAATLVNLGHGNIAEWHSRLAKLRMRLPREKVEFVEDRAMIKAPLAEDEISAMNRFIETHRLVQKAQRRIDLVRCWGRFLFASILIGFAVGGFLSSPRLFGNVSPTVAFPMLVASIGAIGVVGVVMLFNFPHGLDWGRLKDATDEYSAS